MLNLKSNGILFVGDPHLKSTAIGRRKDDFTRTVMNKILNCINIANERNLVLMFLGDLFDSDDDEDTRMLTELIRGFKKLKYTPITIMGNHEKKQTLPMDHNPITLLKEAGLIKTVEKSGIFAKAILNNKVYYIGGTPHGSNIPEKIIRPNDSDGIIWITHHDLAFGGGYPGSIPINEIVGVDLLVNGHIHKHYSPIKAGKMVAFNPGNITRVSVDCKDHIPAAWEFNGDFENLIQHKINFEKDVFFMEGLIFEAQRSNKDEINERKLVNQIEFTDRLKLLLKEEGTQTKDASIFKDYIDSKSIELGLNEEIKSHLLMLLNRSLLDC